MGRGRLFHSHGGLLYRPTGDHAQHILCSDSGSHLDWMQQPCSWLSLHDPGCGRFGTELEKQKCRNTCQSCDLVGEMLVMHDLDKDNHLSPSEFRALDRTTTDGKLSTTIQRLGLGALWGRTTTTSLGLKIIDSCGSMVGLNNYLEVAWQSSLARIRWEANLRYPLTAGVAYRSLKRELELVGKDA